MSSIWNALLDLVENLLRFFYGIFDGLFGSTDSWGWAIIALTVAVRVLLLPLAVKQMRSQRAMQRLAPELKKIQSKYKPDRAMMRSNPEKYRELRAKQQEATMALYKEHGVNPASGCLPLIAQMPIFIALFSVLRGRLPTDASYYFLSDLTKGASELSGLEQVGAILLVGLMGLTTFFSSRQMMATTAASPEQAQQQKIMMYVMPLVLLPISWSIPVGVLLYWVTTNVWTIGQQWFMFRTREAGPAVDQQPKVKPGGSAK